MNSWSKSCSCLSFWIKSSDLEVDQAWLLNDLYLEYKSFANPIDWESWSSDKGFDHTPDKNLFTKSN